MARGERTGRLSHTARASRRFRDVLVRFAPGPDKPALKRDHERRETGKDFFDESKITQRIKALAEEIAAAEPKDLLVVAVLKGSFMFAADLIRRCIGWG